MTRPKYPLKQSYIPKFAEDEIVWYCRKRAWRNRPIVEQVKIHIITRTAAWVYATVDNTFFKIIDLTLLRKLDELHIISNGEHVLVNGTTTVVEVIAIHNEMTFCHHRGEYAIVPLKNLSRLYSDGVVKNPDYQPTIPLAPILPAWRRNPEPQDYQPPPRPTWQNAGPPQPEPTEAERAAREIEFRRVLKELDEKAKMRDAGNE